MKDNWFVLISMIVLIGIIIAIGPTGARSLNMKK